MYFLGDHSVSFTLSNWFSHFIGKDENIKQLINVDYDKIQSDDTRSCDLHKTDCVNMKF